MGRIAFILCFFAAGAWGIDTSGCFFDRLVSSAGRDEPIPIQFEDFAIGDGRTIFQPRKQVMAPGVRGEVGETMGGGAEGYYLQVDAEPGGRPYRHKPGVRDPGTFDAQYLPLGTVVKALRENAGDAKYLVVMGDNVGVDGQVKKVQGPVGLPLKTRQYLERPTSWDGFYKEGHVETSLGQKSDGEYMTYQSVIQRTPSLAAQIARKTGKPVIAPNGEPKTWFFPESGKLELAVYRRTAMTEAILPPEQAFVKVYPDGRVEPVANPLEYVKGREGVKIEYTRENPEFNNPAVIDLRDPSKLRDTRETLEKLKDFGVIDYSEYLSRLRELEEREGED